MKIHFYTFGCKVNQCETSKMQAEVSRAGCVFTGPEDADIIIINSCTVTSNADHKTKQYLRKCLRINTKAKIFLTGCYVERAESSLRNEFPKVKLFKNSNKENILNIIDANYNKINNIDIAAEVFHNRTRAFVKVQDGCNGKCAYCVVPKVRPTLSSKSYDDVVREVGCYVSAGHKEVVLCGIRLGKYEFIENKLKVNITGLIKELEKTEGLYRIRLSSIELNDITDDLIEHMAESKKLCHHLHIPLQSGDDKILIDMKRPYLTKEFLKKVSKIRKKITDIGITTDIIVGYPTDTEETFDNTYNFIKKCKFSRLHIFKFSRRPGTEAELINPVNFKMIRENSSLVKKWQTKLRMLDLQLRHDFSKKFMGKKMEVLTETNGYGYTSNYIYLKLPKKYPENEIIYHYGK
ncbi:MAG: MiaB/RimO family radical SAM methylthiotransferase [Elusimicrobia bacterium]|nr:MiaB/RimO family radical SAM methylthiotransferase [Elusimicrobiota bacterium]